MDSKDFNDFKRQLRQFSNVPVFKLAGTVVIAVLLLWAVFTSFFTIEADEVGVVLRFGDDTEELAQPGLRFKLPFGIDKVAAVKVDRVQTLEFGFRTRSIPARGRTVYEASPADSRLMLTGDQNVVGVEWIVQYKIKNPAHYLFNIKDPEETVRDLSEATMRLVVGDSSATEVLTARRSQIAFEMKEKLQSILDSYESGIDVLAVELQNVEPPTEQVKAAFNEVNTAQQDRERTINEANREYLKAIPQAEGEARKVLQEAEGFKVKRINEARGDVAKFEKLLAEYETSKEVTRARLYLEAIEEVLPKLTTIYVLDESQQGPLQVLDLKEAVGAGARQRSRAPSQTNEGPSASRQTTRTASSSQGGSR